MSVTAPGGGWDAPGAPELLFEGRFEPSKWGAGVPNYDAMPDGRHLVMVRRKSRVEPTVIQVVLNWPVALGASNRSGR